MAPFDLATAGRVADDFGNRDILVQQEIIFTVAGLVRTRARSQGHNGDQRQDCFFHIITP